ncbi:MAG: hypothetical protein WC863_00320 [Patescibacteria group bacterium]
MGIISPFLLSLIIIIVGSSYYWLSTNKQTELTTYITADTTNQSLITETKEKNFSDFLRQKKQLSLKNEMTARRTKQANLNNNDLPEIYALANGRLTITENTQIIWQSSNDWWVDNFILADANNDGIIDINLSVWKSGNFGPSQPFWVKNDDLSVKNHFFIFDLIAEKVEPLWQSSNLTVPNCEFAVTDIDKDGQNDLIVIEGNYTQTPECHGDYIALWKWNDWGFSNEWRSTKGNFSHLDIEKIKEKNN